MAKLLFESDAREKARADAREQHRHAKAHNKELAGLRSQIAALVVIVSDKSLPQDRRRKLAVEITQQHKEARQRPPLKQFVDQVKGEVGVTRDESLEPDYARLYRNPESDDPVLLLKRVAGLGLELSSYEASLSAPLMLKLFYGWTDLDVPGPGRSYGEQIAMFERLRAVKKRSMEEVEQTIQAEIKSTIQGTLAALLKDDNHALLEDSARGFIQQANSERAPRSRRKGGKKVAESDAETS